MGKLSLKLRLGYRGAQPSWGFVELPQAAGNRGYDSVQAWEETPVTTLIIGGVGIEVPQTMAEPVG